MRSSSPPCERRRRAAPRWSTLASTPCSCSSRARCVNGTSLRLRASRMRVGQHQVGVRARRPSATGSGARPGRRSRAAVGAHRGSLRLRAGRLRVSSRLISSRIAAACSNSSRSTARCSSSCRRCIWRERDSALAVARRHLALVAGVAVDAPQQRAQLELERGVALGAAQPAGLLERRSRAARSAGTGRARRAPPRWWSCCPPCRRAGRRCRTSACGAGVCSPFSSAQRSHTWISDILLSWISVKCTVAGFLPQIWQSIARALSAPVAQPAGLERQHAVARARRAYHCGSRRQTSDAARAPART